MLRGQRFVVLLSLACTWALAAPGATDFENLLQKIELTHSKLDDGSYRILVAGDVDATFVNAQVLDLEYKIVFLYCPVLVPPRDVVPPTAFYKKIAELNDEMIVGRLSLTPEGAVFYLKMGIRLTQVAPRCSMPADGRLPSEPDRIRVPF